MPHLENILLRRKTICALRSCPLIFMLDGHIVSFCVTEEILLTEYKRLFCTVFPVSFALFETTLLTRSRDVSRNFCLCPLWTPDNVLIHGILKETY